MRTKASKIAPLLVLVVACQRPEAYVDCRAAGATLASGMACTVDHRAGSKPLHVCWSVAVKCANGAHGLASSCGDVQPKAKVSVLVPYSSFGGALDKCDNASGGAVEGVRLSEL